MRLVLDFVCKRVKHINISNIPCRFCTYKPPCDFGKHLRIDVVPGHIYADKKDPRYTETEEVKGRWHYVEQLFPKLRIPVPSKTVSSTGWRAPAETVPDLPYFVARTRNHMLAVYEDRYSKERILVTRVCKIQGDIWLLEFDLKNFLEEKLGEKVESNVNEMACHINVKGKHVDIIREWLYDKGF